MLEFEEYFYVYLGSLHISLNFLKKWTIIFHRDKPEYFGFEIPQCAQPSELNIDLHLR